MQGLIAVALKSLLIAGITLGLLTLMKRRHSAAERSWVAHIGLLALVMLALAPLVLPNWTVEAPALLGQAPPIETVAQSAPSASAPSVTTYTPAAAAAPAGVSLSPVAVLTAAYALPAVILLFITFLALVRLIALRARADVLVDGHWLSALARAQRRMGFKHGTALLTSNELSSPISWGLMRPVILLNTRAVEASREAEAIIAHELAHVARMDWAKLLLARVATALFWFNPLVWILAREAHQLREETADDAVLAADIADTDYAQLLVGVARHECPGLLLGAHGVAPSKNSLTRRVARVLDGASVRGPVARFFALGVLVGAVMIGAPLAALTLTPGGSAVQAERQARAPGHPAETPPASVYYPAAAVSADLPNIIADGVSTSVATAMAAVAAATPVSPREARATTIAEALATASQAREAALARAGAVREQARAEARAYPLSTGHRDRIIEMKAIGVNADYVNAMRAAAPRLASLDPSDFAGMKAVGVTPEFARGLVAAGFRNIDAEELTEARAIGLSGGYARAIADAGVPLNVDDYVQLRAVGVSTDFVQRLRRAGYPVHDADKIVEMWAVGVRAGDLKAMPPRPPRMPTPPPVNRDPEPDGG